MNIEYLRSALRINYKKNIIESLAASCGVSSNAIEILPEQAARNWTLLEINLTERSDIHKSSIFNLQ